jgi:hypothetical protein
MTIKQIFIFFLLAFTVTRLLSNELIMTNLQEREFTSDGLLYLLKAEKKVIDYKKLRKMNWFNRNEIVSEASNYHHGSFEEKNLKIDFEEGHFYEGDFYMQDCYCSYKDGYIKAKNAVYKKTFVEFRNLLLLQDGKKHHKFTYKVDLELISTIPNN